MQDVQINGSFACNEKRTTEYLILDSSPEISLGKSIENYQGKLRDIDLRNYHILTLSPRYSTLFDIIRQSTRSKIILSCTDTFQEFKYRVKGLKI